VNVLAQSPLVAVSLAITSSDNELVRRDRSVGDLIALQRSTDFYALSGNALQGLHVPIKDVTCFSLNERKVFP